MEHPLTMDDDWGVPSSEGGWHMIIWLVGQGHPSEKYEFVNWDDDIPNSHGKIKNGNQTTNQHLVSGLVHPSYKWTNAPTYPTIPHIFDLVGGWATPLKNMSSSIGMMTFPTEWENKKWQPNHQPVIHVNFGWLSKKIVHSSPADQTQCPKNTQSAFDL